MWSIQSSRPGVQRLADKLATIFVPLVLVLATVATATLLATGSSVSSGLLVGLTVVIVSCPCALGLATPLSIAAGVQAAAKRGSSSSQRRSSRTPLTSTSSSSTRPGR